MSRPPPRSTLFPHPTLFRSRSMGGIWRPRPRDPSLGRALLRRPVDRGGAGPPLVHHGLGVLDAGAVSAGVLEHDVDDAVVGFLDRKSTRLNSSHANISYAVF